MRKAPRLSDVDLILKGLKKSRKELCRLADSLPDEDAYATPYSVLSDAINNIDELLQELKPSIKEAKEYRKQNPEQFPNRARNWCKINSKKNKQEEYQNGKRHQGVMQPAQAGEESSFSDQEEVQERQRGCSGQVCSEDGCTSSAQAEEGIS